MHIQLKENSEPYAVHSTRNVEFHILRKVEAELKRMTEDDIIKPIETTTDWCAAMVPVVKTSGHVRICVKSVCQGTLHKFAKCRGHCPKVSRR